MAQAHRHKQSNPSQPLPMQHVEGGLGMPRGPQGDRAHYDKHGEKLDHDGKRSQGRNQGAESSETRERTPHRSGQEYEYGETPETGLGGHGDAGVDPGKQFARKGTPAEHEHLTSGTGERGRPGASTRQGGGSSENPGIANQRDQHRHPVEEDDASGTQGLAPDLIEEGGRRQKGR